MGFIVNNTTFPGLLDLVAPHSCRGCGALGVPLCERCKKYILAQHKRVCPNCKKEILSGGDKLEGRDKGSTISKCMELECAELPAIYAVGEREGLLDRLVQEYKYKSVRAYAGVLAELIDAVLPRDLGRAVVVPFPTASHHIRVRGMDHTKLIARRLARRRGWGAEPLIMRVRNTVQVGAVREKRMEQAASAYALNERVLKRVEMMSAKDVKDKDDMDGGAVKYILLDDVWTTGATVRAAVKLLASAGIKSDDCVVALVAYSI